jgi:DNA-binding transcriptional LysR family regulator
MVDHAHGLRLRHFNAFLAVADERHVGRAAERLHLTQPAVSKTLTELETILGGRLLDRGRHGAKLTLYGETFLPYARAVLESVTAAGSALIGPTPTATPSVAVGALPTVAPDLLPAALARFRTLLPDARVTLRTAGNAGLLAMVRAGEVDLAIGRMSDPSLTIGLSFEQLYLESLVAVARPGHRLDGDTHVTFVRILDYPLLVCSTGTTPRQNTDDLLQAHGLRLPPHVVETLDVAVGRRIVETSDTVWFVPAGAVRDEVANGRLVSLPIDATGTAEPVGVFTRVDRAPSPPALAFLGTLRDLSAPRR